VTGRWFSPGTPVSFTNKTYRHDIAEIVLKVALNTIYLPTYLFPWCKFNHESIILKKENNEI
jgi:hypothetical protein